MEYGKSITAGRLIGVLAALPRMKGLRHEIDQLRRVWLQSRL